MKRTGIKHARRFLGCSATATHFYDSERGEVARKGARRHRRLLRAGNWYWRTLYSDHLTFRPATAYGKDAR